MAFMRKQHKVCIACTICDSYPRALVVFRGIDNSLRAASELGYDGIELGIYHKSNVDPKELKNKLQKWNLTIPVISTGQMYTMRGLSFTNPDRDIVEKAIKELEDIIELAAEFGADINISRIRGSLDENDSFDEGISKVTNCLERVCSKAQHYGLSILLEHMNRYETNYFLSCAETAEYVKKTGIPNLKVHADLFHMNIEDVDLPATLKRYAEVLGFIHFADSNRLAPGLGNIDFAAIINAINEGQYSGWIGVEILTQNNPYLAAKNSLNYIRNLELIASKSSQNENYI